MKPRRRTGLAADEATAERAGTIASSRGNARVTPIPRRNVRLGSAILVININQLLCAFRRFGSLSCAPLATAGRANVRRRQRAVRFHPPHLEGRALHDADDQ